MYLYTGRIEILIKNQIAIVTSMPNNKIVETNYNKFILFSKNKENTIIPKIVILLKNHYSHIWNSWANRLAKIFLLLSKE